MSILPCAACKITYPWADYLTSQGVSMECKRCRKAEESAPKTAPYASLTDDVLWYANTVELTGGLL